MMSYEATMREGSRAYADVLVALNDAGLPATFIQTGGMCAAIEIRLETGHTLLVTDADDTLSWLREHHAGWGVGLYAPGEDSDRPLTYVHVEASTTPALMEAITKVLEP